VAGDAVGDPDEDAISISDWFGEIEALLRPTMRTGWWKLPVGGKLL